ncbi:acyl-coenzyme A thioesterase 13-like protein, partial [Trifolium pratense]
NSANYFHIGAIITLVDVAGAAAIPAAGFPWLSGVSLEINVSCFHAAYAHEEIEIDARVLRVGKTIAAVSVEFRKKKTGQIFAQGRHTKYLPRTNVMEAVQNGVQELANDATDTQCAVHNDSKKDFEKGCGQSVSGKSRMHHHPKKCSDLVYVVGRWDNIVAFDICYSENEKAILNVVSSQGVVYVHRSYLVKSLEGDLWLVKKNIGYPDHNEDDDGYLASTT